MSELDAKPDSLRFKAERMIWGSTRALARAADRGEDFTRLECADCYGPGYVPGP